MHASSLHGNREIPGSADCDPQSVRSRKAEGHNLGMHVNGKSDTGVVSVKRMNKGAQPIQHGQPPAEFVERRPVARGNSGQATMTGTQRPEAVSSALNRVREAATNASASDPMQEPGAVVPHAGICAGGAGKPAFLPRTKIVS